MTGGGGQAGADLNQARMRLDRASYHGDELTAALQQYKRLDPYALVPEPSADGRTYYRLKVTQPHDEQMALILGDAVHNARVALDYLVVALANHSQGRVLSDAETEHLQFPIRLEPVDLPNPGNWAASFVAKLGKAPKQGQRAGGLYLLDKDFIRRIEQVQPYNGWAYKFPGEPHLGACMAGVRNPLARLDRLSSREKHRRLNLILLDIRDGHVATSAPAGLAAADVDWRWDPGARVSLTDGCVVGSVRTATAPDSAPTISPRLIIEDVADSRTMPIDAFLPFIAHDLEDVMRFVVTGSP